MQLQPARLRRSWTSTIARRSRRIYAAGDVIGFPALASTAMEQARVAMCHAFDLSTSSGCRRVMPYGVWTIPEIATVGETRGRARRARRDVRGGARVVPHQSARADHRRHRRVREAALRSRRPAAARRVDRRRGRVRADSPRGGGDDASAERSTTSSRACSTIRRSPTRTSTRRTTDCRRSRDVARGRRVCRRAERAARCQDIAAFSAQLERV